MAGTSGVSEPMPDGVRPMLATAGPVPAGPGWSFEFRWEGLRSIAHVGPDGLRLFNGSDRDVAASYPELAELVERAAGRPVVLDGKIVALDEHGRPSIDPLRRRMNVRRPNPALLRRAPVAYYVTDLLYVDGRSTLAMPLRQRRELLDALALAGGPVVVPPSFTDADGQVVVETAVRFGLDGVIAKRLDSPYRPGRRSRSWVETVLRPSTEVVIGGWLARDDTGHAVDALLVGVPSEASGLRYVGRVSTGMTAAQRRELGGLLANLATEACPFVVVPPRAGGARWVRPQLVGEVGFRRWTADGALAHPSWRRLRPDGDPDTVRDPMPGVTTAPPVAEPDSGAVAAARLRALHDQISPHFVYNALNTIAALVRSDPGSARGLLVDFAEFSRYSFRPGAELTRLADELAATEQYLHLEQARFGTRLRAEVRAEPTVGGVVLPFLAVQSVVEHAVRDGIEATADGGSVTVTATAAGADCLVVVRTRGGRPDWPDRAVADLTTRLHAAFGDEFEVSVRGTGTAEVAVGIRVPTTGRQGQ